MAFAFDLPAARAAIARICRRTPLVPAPTLGEGIFLKLESLQRTGSFKPRGACAALSGLEADEVVVASAGNHGLGTAYAARALGKRATVLLPETTPEIKRAQIAALGADVRVVAPTYDGAEAAARALARERAVPFVSPFDDDAVIFGNGVTVAEEILEQQPRVRTVIAPIGGGGLVAGLCAVLPPRVAVRGVQPAANCAMAESLRLGRALVTYQGHPTLCEGLEGAVSERTFAAVRAAEVAITLVEEAAVRRAMAFAYRSLGLLCEPSAAVGIAALREGGLRPATPAVVVITGANVEPSLLDEVLREE